MEIDPERRPDVEGAAIGANRGVDSSRMSAIGYGESYPAASNETPLRSARRTAGWMSS